MNQKTRQTSKMMAGFALLMHEHCRVPFFLAVVLLLACGMASASARALASPARSYAPQRQIEFVAYPLGDENFPPGSRNGLFVSNNPINLIDPLGLEDFRMFPPGQSFRQFDAGPNVYDIGSHGNPNAVFDESGNPMSPQDLLDRVKNDPKFQNAERVQLWACEVGQGDNSFAQRFADLSGKPTSGPNQLFWENGRNGTVALRDSNGNQPGGVGGLLGRMFSWNWRNFNPR